MVFWDFQSSKLAIILDVTDNKGKKTVIRVHSLEKQFQLPLSAIAFTASGLFQFLLCICQFVFEWDSYPGSYNYKAMLFKNCREPSDPIL